MDGKRNSFIFMAHENSDPQGPSAPSGKEKRGRGRPKKAQPDLTRRNVALTHADELYLMRGVERLNGYRDFITNRKFMTERISASWLIRALIRYFEDKSESWDPRTPGAMDILNEILMYGHLDEKYHSRLQVELDKAIATVGDSGLWADHPDKIKAREFLNRLGMLHSSDLNKLKLKIFPE
jgi:hypothetical protein